MVGTVFVTGASGVLGTELIKQLSQNNIKTIAAVKNGSDSSQITLPNVEIVQLDLEDINTFKNCMNGVEKVFMIIPTVDKMPQITQNIITIAKQSDVKSIIQVSALDVDIEKDIAMGKIHFECEKLLKNSGLNWTILRPNAFMQNFITRHGSSIKNQNKIFAATGNSKTSFIDAKDIASFTLEILKGDYNKKTFALTGPKALSYSEVAQIISAVSGKNISFVEITDDALKESMKSDGMQDWFIQATIEINQMLKRGDCVRVEPDFEIMMGRQARSFEQFAKENSKFWM